MNDIPIVNYPDASAGSPYSINGITPSGYNPKDISRSTLNMDRCLYLMEQLWRNHNDKLEVSLSEQNCYNLEGLEELKDITKELHDNISGSGRHLTSRELVFGMGATQCLYAALYAIRVMFGVSKVTATLPGYYEYKRMVDMFHPLEWVKESEEANSSTIEIVCSPNNPDGRIQVPSASSAYTIHDRVNHWPWFYEHVRDFHAEDFSTDEISIFSYPKILGFSASRVGYAWVKDPEIA